MKNSNKNEDIIKIPVNRVTFYQNYLKQRAGQLGMTHATMIEQLDLEPIDYCLQENDWMLIDTGYVLTISQKETS